MIDEERPSFAKTARELAIAFGRKLPEPRIDVYFDALGAYPLGAVLASAQVLRDTHKHFPTIAEWLEAVRRQAPPAPPASHDVRWMTAAECDALAWAAAHGFEDEQPCLCAACVRANVEDRPRRFVPHDDERAWNPRMNKLETPGHWAHGEELARWYAARDGFFSRLGPRKVRTLNQAVATIAGRWQQTLSRVREPGEEG